MTRKTIAKHLLLLSAVLVVGLSAAQSEKQPATKPSSGEVKASGANVSSNVATANRSAGQGGANVSATVRSSASQRQQSPRPANDQTAGSGGTNFEKESNRQIIIDKINKVDDDLKGLSNNLNSMPAKISEEVKKILTTPAPSVDGNENKLLSSSSLPAWIAAGVGLLSIFVVCCGAIVVSRRIADLNKCIQDGARSQQNEDDGIQNAINSIRTLVSDIPKPLLVQMKQLSDAVQGMDRKFGKFAQSANDIPKQLDAVVKTMSRDAESNRGSIVSWLFGRGKTLTPEKCLTQEIEERMGQFQSAVLDAVESDHKLQSRKNELDERERRLKDREKELDAACARAREEGAAIAERRAMSLESANKLLAESMNIKAVEFGKRVAELEGERTAAKTAAQQAVSDSVAARSQADAAVKLREKLSAEVSRLAAEIAKRDAEWDAALSNARDKARSEMEKAHADEVAALRAEANNARADRDRAQSAAETLMTQKSEAFAEIASLKSVLESETAARKADQITAKNALEAEKAARESDRQNAVKEREKLSMERDAAKSRVFPAEFSGDPDFQSLLSLLDMWDCEKLPGATLARASLAIFADRRNLLPKIWLPAIGNLSLGISSAMYADGKSPAEVAEVLGKWKSAVEKIGTAEPTFTLRLPIVGSTVDTSWMYAKQGSAKVSRIRTWAVYRQSGNGYLAEVE